MLLPSLARRAKSAKIQNTITRDDVTPEPLPFAATQHVDASGLRRERRQHQPPLADEITRGRLPHPPHAQTRMEMPLYDPTVRQWAVAVNNLPISQEQG